MKLLVVFCCCLPVLAALPEAHRVTSLPGVDLAQSNASHFSGYLQVQKQLNVVRDFAIFVNFSHAQPTTVLLLRPASRPHSAAFGLGEWVVILVQK